MESQQLTRSGINSQLARPSNTSEAAAIMRRFEQLSELTGWAGILHALAQDKRHDLAPHVIELWKVKLARFRGEDITEVLIGGEWKFFPSVDEVIVRLEGLAESRYFAREEERTRQMLEENRVAREAAQDPQQKAEIAKIIRTLGERLTFRHMETLARRAPQNVKALSQAKALRSVGGRDAAA